MKLDLLSMRINMLNLGDIVESTDHYFGIIIDPCPLLLGKGQILIKWHDGQITPNNEMIFEPLKVNDEKKLHLAKLKLNGNGYEDR